MTHDTRAQVFQIASLAPSIIDTLLILPVSSARIPQHMDPTHFDEIEHISYANSIQSRSSPGTGLMDGTMPARQYPYESLQVLTCSLDSFHILQT